MTFPLLAIVDISAVQSSVQTFVHNAIMLIDTSDNAWYNQTHWLIRTPYLSTIASNEVKICVIKESTTEFCKWDLVLFLQKESRSPLTLVLTVYSRDVWGHEVNNSVDPVW